MYRLIKALNNNTAVVRLENGEQAIAMGKGLAFQKKKGDLVPEAQASNLFLLRDKDVQHSFAELLKNIPLDYIRTTYEIIDEAVNSYQYPVQEYLYVTLTDHVYWSCQNLQKGVYEPSKLPDFSQEYPLEMTIGAHAVNSIRQRIDSQYPDDEVVRIALHFINAKRPDKPNQRSIKPKLDLLSLVESELQRIGLKRTQENKNFYDRLMIHLTYFTENLERDSTGQQGLSQELESHLKEDYPRAYAIGAHLYQLIKRNSGKKLSSAERIYLTLHIQRLL